MNALEPDYVAARVHWRNADRHRDAAERLRKNKCPLGAAAALTVAEQEERMALKLEGRS